MNKAFTLIEVALIIAVISILLSISTFNLLNFQDHATLDTTIETFISDVKQQQLKAMSGSTEGNQTTAPFGIFIENHRYTLFTGTTFNSSDPLNFTLSLNDTITITTTFSQNRFFFIKGSGEIQNFTQGSNTITFIHTPSNLQKTITINKYGVITSVQ